MRTVELVFGWGLWLYLIWNARAGIRRDLRRFRVLGVVGLLWRLPHLLRRPREGATL